MKINGNPDGGGGASVWGQITGTIDNQIDLKNKFNNQDSSIKEWVEDKGYLTEHQTLKTINGESVVGTGDIEVGGGVGQKGEGNDSEIFNSYTGSYKNTATGIGSHAEGSRNTVSGKNSHVEGYNNTVSGISAHAEGNVTSAAGNNSHAEGDHTIAEGVASHAEGRYNIGGATFQHTVGIGSPIGRKNAYLITNTGEHYILGVGGYEGTETDVTYTQDVATVINNKLEGTSLKTINGQSLVGSGDIEISGGNTDEIEDVIATGYVSLKDEISRVEDEIPDISNYYTKTVVDVKVRLEEIRRDKEIEKSDAIVAQAIYFLTQNS